MANVEDYELNFNQDGEFDLNSQDGEQLVIGFNEPERVQLEFDEPEDLQLNFDTPDDNLELGFGEVLDGRTDDFNRLYNRPSYNGTTMTGATNIQVDSQLSSTSTNAVQNRVIYSSMATKANTNDLAPVAFSGEYNDLTGEPRDFTQAEWNLLWRNY